METEYEFYICLTCFEIVDDLHKHQGHKIIGYPGFPIGHEQLKPPTDAQGNLKTHLPRWILKGLSPVNLPMASA